MTTLSINQEELFDATDRSAAGLTTEEKEMRRQRATCGVFQKTNRILLGTLDVEVSPITNDKLPPGWTNGREIYLNFHHLNGRSDRDLIAMWGLNYHELAHIILTPRIKQTLRQLVKNEFFATGLNIAEDWRIETQFSALFTEAARYFQISFADLIVNRPDADEGDIYGLAAGRIYLPAASRERWRRAFAAKREDVKVRDHMPQPLYETLGQKHPDLLDLMGEGWANAVRDVAEEYVVLAWGKDKASRDRNRHLVALAERVAILTLTPPQGGGGGGDQPWGPVGTPTGEPGDTDGPGGRMYGRDMPSQGGFDENMSEVAAEAALEILTRSREEAERVDAALKEAGLDGDVGQVAPSPGENPGDSGNDRGNSGGQSKGKAKSDGKAKQDKIVVNPEQGIVIGGTASAADVQGGLSAGAGRDTTWEGRAARTAQMTAEQRALVDRVFSDTRMHDELLQDEIDTMSSHRSVQRNIASVRRSVAEALGEGIDLAGTGSAEVAVAPPEIRSERNRLARYLRDVRAQLEGTYVGDQSSGKVHLRSWINATPAQKPHSFRAWLPDEVDEMGLEVVGLIDRSSSMSGVIDHASQVTWALASAVQQTEGKVTIIGFADPGKEEVLVGRARQLSASHYDSYGTYGGTHVAEALKLARQVLAASDQPNRLLYIVTDGGWGDLKEALVEIRKINADGVDTLLVLLGMDMEREHRGCKYVVQANDTAQMGRMLSNVIKRMSQNAARRVSIDRGVVA